MNTKSRVKQKTSTIEKVKEAVDVSLFKISVYITAILVFSALIVTFGIKAYNLSVENKWLMSQIREMRLSLENLTEDYYNLSSQIQSINIDEK